MGEEQIFVKFAGEEDSSCRQFKVASSVPASEEKKSQPNNGPNMKQTNVKQSVVDHHKVYDTKCGKSSLTSLLLNSMAPQF